jgi:hypothetical protein
MKTPKTVKYPTGASMVKYWTAGKEQVLTSCDNKIAYHTKEIKRLEAQIELYKSYRELAVMDRTSKEAFYDGRIATAQKKCDAEQNGSAAAVSGSQSATDNETTA